MFAVDKVSTRLACDGDGGWQGALTMMIAVHEE